jgi:hypothetical protein
LAAAGNPSKPGFEAYFGINSSQNPHVASADS